MAINIEYENSRQQGDPIQAPAGWTSGGNNSGGASNAFANNSINNANAQFGAITSDLRRANEQNRARIDSQTEGQLQGARDFEFASQNFARARLGKIGGFEGTYGIGLQNSIAARTESNIQAIKRAGDEAKAAGDFELSGRLAELGLQQMTLIAQLNNQAFEQSKFATQNKREDARFAVEDARYLEAQKLAGADFMQLDNGDYGYWDKATRQFVKQGNAAKPSGGSDTIDSVSGLPKGFTAATEDGRSELQKGVSWGEVWNRIRSQFPTVSNQQIDTFLGGSGPQAGQGPGEGREGPVGPTREATGWAKAGAFEDFKRANLAGTYDETRTAVEVAQDIYAASATEKWSTMTPQERELLIRQNGGNPADYYSIINQR